MHSTTEWENHSLCMEFALPRQCSRTKKHHGRQGNHNGKTVQVAGRLECNTACHRLPYPRKNFIESHGPRPWPHPHQPPWPTRQAQHKHSRMVFFVIVAFPATLPHDFLTSQRNRFRAFRSDPQKQDWKASAASLAVEQGL